MADQNIPNDASRKNKAEGERSSPPGPGVEWNRQLDRDEVVNRRRTRATPRRCDQPVEEDE